MSGSKITILSFFFFPLSLLFPVSWRGWLINAVFFGTFLFQNLVEGVWGWHADVGCLLLFSRISIPKTTNQSFVLLLLSSAAA